MIKSNLRLSVVSGRVHCTRCQISVGANTPSATILHRPLFNKALWSQIFAINLLKYITNVNLNVCLSFRPTSLFHHTHSSSPIKLLQLLECLAKLGFLVKSKHCACFMCDKNQKSMGAKLTYPSYALDLFVRDSNHSLVLKSFYRNS